jgi:GNAT superfamily N-acetyltransferase
VEIHTKASPIDDQIPASERDTFARWAAEIFAGSAVAKHFTWVNHWAYQVVVYRGSTPVSYLRLVDRIGLVDGYRVRMGGVADVMTPPDHRGKGFAGLALDEARNTIFDTMKAQLGVLLCAEELVHFYARHDWQLVDCPVTIDQPGGRRVWPQCTMVLGRPGETWVPKSIDLCGLPW